MNVNKFMETNLRNLHKALSTLTMDEFVVNCLESLMTIDRDYYLKCANDPTEKGNGYYTRLFRSLTRNSLTIQIPRTRNAGFYPMAMEVVKQNKADIDDFCLLLTQKGMTTRDISDVLKKFFGENKSHTSINNLAEKFRDLRMAWENSKLEKHYVAVFCDVLFVVVRRGDSYSKEGVYLACGVREDGKREVLLVENSPTESTTVWGEFFEKLRVRGVEKIDLIVADGLKGLEDEVLGTFKGSLFQKCVVHKMRNILNKTRPKDKGQMAIDLKEIFYNFEDSANLADAMRKLEEFCLKWEERYSNIRRFFNEGETEYYFTYLKFPPSIRRMIYTTNCIENLNKTIRKATKNKLSFESPDTLLDYVFMAIKDFEDSNWMKYPVHQFRNLNSQTQLS
jgi:putative transposase